MEQLYFNFKVKIHNLHISLSAFLGGVINVLFCIDLVDLVDITA